VFLCSPCNVGLRVRLAALLCCSAFVAGTPLLAQTVGYPPSQSPYEDIASPQRLTVFGGYFDARRDEAGAAPQSAPMIGAQYEVTIDGPAQFFVRGAWVNSQRNAFNPALPAPSDELGKFGDALFLGDLGISLNLTGQRTWHHLIPTVAFGVGLASARGSVTDDPYDFGTQFSFSADLGLNYVLGKNYEFRVGLGNTFYQNHYPAGYYTITSDSSSIVRNGVSKTSYLSNWRLTAGLAVPLFR
jgi:hypothetical protein